MLGPRYAKILRHGSCQWKCIHACMRSRSPEKGFVGTLITGKATDDLRMGVKILSEVYLVWIHTGATLFSTAHFLLKLVPLSRFLSLMFEPTDMFLKAAMVH